MDSQVKTLAIGATIAAVVCAFIYFNQQSGADEAQKQGSATQQTKASKKKKPGKKGRAYDAPLAATTTDGKKKKEDKTPKSADISQLDAVFKVGETVEVNGGNKGWIPGTITGPPLQTKAGTVLYMVRRASSRPDPNNTGEKHACGCSLCYVDVHLWQVSFATLNKNRCCPLVSFARRRSRPIHSAAPCVSPFLSCD